MQDTKLEHCSEDYRQIDGPDWSARSRSQSCGPETGRQVHGHKVNIMLSNLTALSGVATPATGVTRQCEARQGDHGARTRTQNATQVQDVVRRRRHNARELSRISDLA